MKRYRVEMGGSVVLPTDFTVWHCDVAPKDSMGANIVIAPQNYSYFKSSLGLASVWVPKTWDLCNVNW